MRYPEGKAISPLSERVVHGLRALVSRGSKREDVFAKVGDSHTVSRAYLRCLGFPSVRVGREPELEPTLAFFRDGDAGGIDPFRRQSLAAAVGWSARHVLVGRPSALEKELDQTHSRYALILLGSNDLESGAPRRYVRRMWRITELAMQEGVVPMLASIPPRGDDVEKNREVPLYNLVIRGIAEHFGLPYLDINTEMLKLPRWGLAGDGLHPSVLVERGRGRPCDFSDEGLTYGHNLINLRVLELLHRLRKTVGEREAAPDRALSEISGLGTPATPVVADGFPYSYVGEPAAADRGPWVHRFRVSEAKRYTFAAFRPGGEGRLGLRLQQQGREVAAEVSRIDVDLEPGVYELFIRTSAPDDSPYLVTALETPEISQPPERE